jgi:hypothetical protein
MTAPVTAASGEGRDGPSGRGAVQTAVLGLVAAAVFAVAFLSPVSMADTDPALALLAAQSVVEHGTLSLDPYAGQPGLGYDLDTDYRVRRIGGRHYYYSAGVPLVSLPAVAVLRGFGFDMRQREVDFAVQNLLSALCCAVLFALFFATVRVLLPFGPSLAIAAVSALGTPVVSTLATGLWTSDYALVFIALGLLRVALRERLGARPLDLPVLAACAFLAFLCRPASGLFGVAALVYLAGEPDRRIARAAAVGLAFLALLTEAACLVPLDFIPAYYSPAKLRPANPLGRGLYEVLLSPSRGLFVFSPFLAVVAAVGLAAFRRLRRDRLYVFALAALALPIVFTAMKAWWWGGHAFGPRLLAETIPPFVVLSGLAWRAFRDGLGVGMRRTTAAAYLATGALAIAINAGLGLFNPAVRRWNESPDVDKDPELLRSWRYSQLLASDATLEARSVAYQRARAGVYRIGETLRYDSSNAVFAGFDDPEGGFRWGRGPSSSVSFRLPAEPPPGRCLLQIVAAALERQRARLRLNGVPVDEIALGSLPPASRLVEVPGELLQPGALNTLEISLDHASRAAGDPRWLGVALRSLRLFAVPADLAGIGYADDAFFGEGWAAAEAGWRWTDGERAVVLYPLQAVDPAAVHTLELRAGAHAAQRVFVLLNGEPLGEVQLSGFAPVLVRLAIPAERLRAHALNSVELRIPGAARTPADARRLGVALVSLRIRRG